MVLSILRRTGCNHRHGCVLRLPSETRDIPGVTAEIELTGDAQRRARLRLGRESVLASFIHGLTGALPSNTRGKSRMLESGLSGSVRGVLSNGHPLYVADCLVNEHIG
jgi:hypothetical protein